MQVIKMNGTREEVDYNKINKQLHIACAGLQASPSLIAMRSNIQLKDDMHTSRIQDILIQTTKDLITEDQTDYSIVAARLISHKLRKFAYGHYQPPSLKEHIQRCVALGKYDTDILTKWDDADLYYFDDHIDHQRDNNFHLAAMNQFVGKYLMRTDKSDSTTVIETPQMVYMLIAMCLHDNRDDVVECYEQFSTHKVSLPTPIMSGVRSPTKQFSSCVLVDAGDSLSSINHTTSTIVDYVSDRAGIGMNFGRLRGVGANIGHGEKSHTGILPFLKYGVAALKSCSQGGVRGGAATAYFPLWHWEIREILTWKNNRGTEETRERRCDYGIQINDTMLELFAEDGEVYLFDPHPELYEAYFRPAEEFEAVYNKFKALADKGEVRAKRVRATELFSEFVDARFETGRYYPFFVNNANNFSPFGETYPIYMSNLCLEIALPTKPAEHYDDESGLVSLCTLMSINSAKFYTPELIRTELPKTVAMAVKTLDNLLSYQNYNSPHAARSTELFRTLGIGVVGWAHFLALNHCSYGSKKGLELTNLFWATMYYHGKSTSIDLAVERGKCGASDNLQPFVHYRHEQATNLTERLGVGLLEDVFDWTALEARFKKHGIRNATLFAVAPTETSSQLLNETNGVEMPRSVVSVKASKDSAGSRQVIPDPHLKEYYDFLWEQASPRPYLETTAVISRWCDQSISTNTPYNPALFPNGKIPREVLMADLVYAWSLGHKTLYYSVIHDNATDEAELPPVVEEDDPCGGACII